jgi:hypothetical protein
MTEKRNKADVDYGPGDLDGEHCGGCKHFEPPRACYLVEGRIRSSAWCKLYAAKGKKE